MNAVWYVVAILAPFALESLARTIKRASFKWDSTGMTPGARRRNQLRDIEIMLREIESERRVEFRTAFTNQVQEEHWLAEKWGEAWVDVSAQGDLSPEEQDALTGDRMKVYWAGRGFFSAGQRADIAQRPLIARRSALRRETLVGSLRERLESLIRPVIDALSRIFWRAMAARRRARLVWRWLVALHWSRPK